jgi:hypothetical protein
MDMAFVHVQSGKGRMSLPLEPSTPTAASSGEQG